MLFPSGSGYMIHDLLAKGLAELGHDVFYRLGKGADKPLPPGVKLVSKIPLDAHMLHTLADHDDDLNDLIREKKWGRKPWVATCHVDLTVRGRQRSATTVNWIFVSRTLARLHGRNRYVLNGIDPARYIFSAAKDDYFLFMSSMNWGTRKGLDIVLSLAGRLGFKLVVAGTGSDYASINRAADMCRKVGADYVGDVKGTKKAELLAGAKAFLFPTKVDEAFGLGMVEALISGTPVICSDRGACPEIISPDVGFVCRNDNDYVSAINNVISINRHACRAKAMHEYHYLRMASDYVFEYQKELARNGLLNTLPAKDIPR